MLTDLTENQKLKRGLFIVLIAFLFSLTLASSAFSAYLSKNPPADSIQFKALNIQDADGEVLHSGTFRYSATLLDSVPAETSYALIMARLSCDWFRITLNGVDIGGYGTQGRYSNIWNSPFIFYLKDLKPDSEITVYGNSSGSVNPSEMLFLLCPEDKAALYYNTLKMTLDIFYIISIGFLIGLSFIIVLLYMSNRSSNPLFFILPLGGLFFSVYLLDFVPIMNLPISKMLFRKITISSLALAVAVTSYAVYRITGKRIVLWSALVSLAGNLFPILTFYNFTNFQTAYHITNLLYLVNFTVWIVVSSTQIQKRPENKFILGLSILALSTTAVDIFIMILRISDIKFSIYMMTFVLICFELIAVSLLIEDEKRIHLNLKFLVKEQHILKKALYTDHITGLFNQRQMEEYFQNTGPFMPHNISIIQMEIQNFSLLNKKAGTENGDRILNIITEYILAIYPEKHKIFRCTGTLFCLVIEQNDWLSPLDICENLRKKIQTSAEILRYSNGVPLGLTCGIITEFCSSPDFEKLYEKAELALRYANQKGGNKTIVYSDELLPVLSETNSDHIKTEFLLDFVVALAGAIDAKDSYAGLHSQEVSRYALLIAEAMDLTERQKYYLRIGGLLHDLGKLGIENDLLHKTSGFSISDREQVQRHTIIGSNMAKQMFNDGEIDNCIRFHHERFDGTGYPDHLTGEDIPLLGRIICVADSYHAMISNRIYRDALTKEKALNELIRNTGKQFDPIVVSAFLKCVV